MKKTTIVLVIVFLGLGGYFTYESKLHSKVFGRFSSKDLALVQKDTFSFMEDNRFKDLERAASYHSPEDKERVEIPKSIEKMFKVKPEQLDIMEYEVLDKSLDSSGKRARVKVKAKVNILNTNTIKDPEIIFYFHKKDGKWYMELESSLK